MTARAVASLFQEEPSRHETRNLTPLRYPPFPSICSHRCGGRQSPCGFRQSRCGFRQYPCGFQQSRCGVRQRPCGFQQSRCGFQQSRAESVNVRVDSSNLRVDSAISCGFQQSRCGFRQSPCGFQQSPCGFHQSRVWIPAISVRISFCPVSNLSMRSWTRRKFSCVASMKEASFCGNWETSSPRTSPRTVSLHSGCSLRIRAKSDMSLMVVIVSTSPNSKYTP